METQALTVLNRTLLVTYKTQEQTKQNKPLSLNMHAFICKQDTSHHKSNHKILPPKTKSSSPHIAATAFRPCS